LKSESKVGKTSYGIVQFSLLVICRVLCATVVAATSSEGFLLTTNFPNNYSYFSVDLTV